MSTPVIITLLFLAFVTLRLSRLRDRRPRRSSRDAAPGVTVPLKARNALVDATTRQCLAIAAVGLVIGGAVLVAGRPGPGIGIVLLTVGLPAITAWNIRLGHGGVIELRNDALVIRVRNAIHEYPWCDIRAVHLSTWSESGRFGHAWLRATGADAAEPFVRVRLARSVGMTIGVWKTRYGTEVIGLPTFVRQIKVFVDDPASFVALAQPYLPGAQPSARAA